MSDLSSIARGHIILIAMLATLVFGFVLSGSYPAAAALLCGVDWFLINLTNRLSDVPEDRLNRIPGTEAVARRSGVLASLCVAVLLLSVPATLLLARPILWLRLLVLLIGLMYSCRLLPTPSGWRRLKDIYLLKNLASVVLFCMTCVGYPLLQDGARGAAVQALWLVLFFLPFELTYEILYDLRDLEGDRRAQVPTFPVIHGPLAARRIIDGLLILSALSLAAGVTTGHLGVREGLMLLAPALQALLVHSLLRGTPSPRACVLVTHLGSAQLLLFLLGTRLWLHLGLPGNLHL